MADSYAVIVNDASVDTSNGGKATVEVTPLVALRRENADLRGKLKTQRASARTALRANKELKSLATSLAQKIEELRAEQRSAAADAFTLQAETIELRNQLCSAQGELKSRYKSERRLHELYTQSAKLACAAEQQSELVKDEMVELEVTNQLRVTSLEDKWQHRAEEMARIAQQARDDLAAAERESADMKANWEAMEASVVSMRQQTDAELAEMRERMETAEKVAGDLRAQVQNSKDRVAIAEATAKQHTARVSDLAKMVQRHERERSSREATLCEFEFQQDKQMEALKEMQVRLEREQEARREMERQRRLEHIAKQQLQLRVKQLEQERQCCRCSDARVRDPHQF